MIPLVLPQILAIMLVGGIVTKFGVYVRFPSILLLGNCSYQLHSGPLRHRRPNHLRYRSRGHNSHQFGHVDCPLGYLLRHRGTRYGHGDANTLYGTTSRSQVFHPILHSLLLQANVFSVKETHPLATVRPPDKTPTPQDHIHQY